MLRPVYDNRRATVAKRPVFDLRRVLGFVDNLFGGELHAKRVLSLANATLGLLSRGTMRVHAIGQGLAEAQGRVTKHAIKQVDRLLSNQGIDVGASFAYWVPHAIGGRPEIVVALDWTEFDADGHSTIALHLVTRHGRATPLLWKTVLKSKLKRRRSKHERDLLRRLRELVPLEVKVTVLADRGFGSKTLYRYLHEELGFEYVIRFRGNISVTSSQGETRPASKWVGQGGRAKTLRDASVTKHGYQVPTIVCVHAKAMKEPWCLVASDPRASARLVIDYYAKRWSIEPSFRDTKDLRFGMGMSHTHIKNPERRDRMFLLNAFAILLMTLLGAAGESLGFDRLLKANTVKYRTHSLFRQGCMYYGLIPKMPQERLRPLIQRFIEMLTQQPTAKDVLAMA